MLDLDGRQFIEFACDWGRGHVEHVQRRAATRASAVTPVADGEYGYSQ